MVVSVKAQGAGGWRYHEDSADKAREALAGEADLAGYYGTDAARPGRWVGTAEDLARYRLGAPRGLVDREQLAAVMDGGRLGDGTEVLPAPAGGGARAGRALYDVTYSAPKSVSVLWSDADPAGRARIEAAVLRAAETVLADLSGHAAYVRRGRRRLVRRVWRVITARTRRGRAGGSGRRRTWRGIGWGRRGGWWTASSWRR